MKVAPRSLSSAALAKLVGYEFPGNVRELRNLLERAHILGQHAELQPEDFPLTPGLAPANGTGVELDAAELDAAQLVARLPPHLDLREVLRTIEIALLERALRGASGVQAEAARQLNLSRSDLGYKLSKYGLGSKRSSSQARPPLCLRTAMSICFARAVREPSALSY